MFDHFQVVGSKDVVK